MIVLRHLMDMKMKHDNRFHMNYLDIAMSTKSENLQEVQRTTPTIPGLSRV